MPRITFVDVRGGRHELDGTIGTSLMELGAQAGVPGILAECGGSCVCATCHVHIGAPWRPIAGEISKEEEGLLDSLDGREPGSRLSCQITLSEPMDGMIVQVPSAA